MATPVAAVQFKVEGKSAIITGAGSGINFEFAKLLLSQNCNVVIADLSLRPEAQQLIDTYNGKDSNLARAVFVKTNVTIWDEITRMFDEAEREFGGFDLVCPGAGVFEPHWSNFWRPPGTEPSRDDLRGTPAGGVGHYGTLDLNITHPIRTTQVAITRWLNGTDKMRVSPDNPKRIVHISSIAGQISGLAVPLYCASKHAISGFIRSLADLETLGIRVNGVAPGLIQTPLWTDHPEKMKMMDDEFEKWVMPSEVAEQMLRCAEEDSIGPGVVWEVLKGAYRVVSNFNDPGPDVEQVRTKNADALPRETMELLVQPGWGLPK